jgi:hypothetical protein
MHHLHMPTRHGIGVMVFSMIVFFGPWLVALRYPSPLPPYTMDFFALWYVIGGVALLTAVIGPAHSKREDYHHAAPRAPQAVRASEEQRT